LGAALCAESTDDWDTVNVLGEAAGSVMRNPVISVANGFVHVMAFVGNRVDGGDALLYTQCWESTGCNASNEWTTPVVVDGVSAAYLATTGAGPMDSVTPVTYSGGKLQVAYHAVSDGNDGRAANVRYVVFATCPGFPQYDINDCATTADAWNQVSADRRHPQWSKGTQPTVAFYDNRMFVAYPEELHGDLKITACDLATNCYDESRWTSFYVDATGSLGYAPKLVTDDNGLSVFYYDNTTASVRRRRCIGNCHAAAGWDDTLNTADTAYEYTDASGDVQSNYSSVSTAP
jgi:hypothetical protein